MSTSTQPVLDLDAELLDLEVTLKDATYKLRSRSELSILELRQFRAVLHEYDTLTDIEDVDDETAVKIGEVLQKIVATLVVDPPEGGFHDQQCAAILGFWTEKHREADPPTRRKVPQDRKPKAKSTGAK